MIDEWLRADRDAPRKQRHTAKRIFDRLLDEYDAGIDQVSYQMLKSYVAGRREQLRVEAGRGVANARSFRRRTCPGPRRRSTSVMSR